MSFMFFLLTQDVPLGLGLLQLQLDVDVCQGFTEIDQLVDCKFRWSQHGRQLTLFYNTFRTVLHDL